MRTIYEPKGRAREYSPLALNIYNGCDHDCSYCYARRWKDDWANVEPRKDLAVSLSKYLEVNRGRKWDQVLLCFSGDPYCQYEMQEKTVPECGTEFVLRSFLDHAVPTAILTKGGTRCLRDIELFKKFGPNIKVGATLTIVGNYSKAYEPGAATSQDRIVALQTLHEQGIRTWVSFEPVLRPTHSLGMMGVCRNFVDEVKIGKVNYRPDLEKDIDWSHFLGEALRILRGGPKIYVKEDLRQAAPDVEVPAEMCDPDAENLVWR